ncbi:MAG: hypothetical protein ACI845_000640 [Gammaproteobacteria bacterium]|jgi:hypothetical protein
MLMRAAGLWTSLTQGPVVYELLPRNHHHCLKLEKEKPKTYFRYCSAPLGDLNCQIGQAGDIVLE